jgi:predicted RNase H-like HicB family nuclease
MGKRYTLEYWRDGKWYVGKLKGLPGLFSQGKSLEELERNIRDLYHQMTEAETLRDKKLEIKRIEIEI